MKMAIGGTLKNRPTASSLLVAIGAVLLCMVGSLAYAQPPAAEQEVKQDAKTESQVVDKQFTEKLNQAKSSDNRDDALADLAKEQTDAGKPAAAIVAAVHIADDQRRSEILAQQQPDDFQGFNPRGRGFNRRFGGRQNGPVGGNNNIGNQPNAGGGTQADFDTLIDLITTTVSPESWEEVGGTGSAAGFPGGVLIETNGLMKRGETNQEKGRARRLKSKIRKQLANKLNRKQVAAASSRRSDGEKSAEAASGDWNKELDAEIRCISLPRLETALMARRAAGLPPTPEMMTLAGLERIEYVMSYPDTHDVVLVGSAIEDANLDARHRLSDLAVLLSAAKDGNGQMVCSITPRQQNLAATQAFLSETATRSLKPGERQSWLDTIQSKMGRQDIEFSGVDPQTHVAHVLIAADYHMKLIGMGLEPGVDGVTSYLDSVKVGADGSLPPMDVLRWWFTLRNAAVTTSGDLSTFRIPRDLVRVQSENEMLTDRGARIHTGESEPLNRKFAASFTEHFELLAEKYPIYAELQQVFEMAVASAIIFDEHLDDQAGWYPTLLVEAGDYLVPDQPVPTEVESVVAHRVIDKRHVVAGISGGVDLAPRRDLAEPTTAEDTIQLQKVHAAKRPEADRRESPDTAINWWW